MVCGVYVYVYVCVVSVCLCVWVCLCVNYSMVVGLYGLGVGVWCGCVVCRRAVYRLPPICGGRSASRESQPQLLPPVQEGRKLHRREGKGSAVLLQEKVQGRVSVLVKEEKKQEEGIVG